MQILFLQGHSTCFGRKRPSSGIFKTSTAATGTCVIVAGKSSHLLISAGVLNTPDDGRLRPKHVEWTCRNKTCTVLHQVGVSFDLYYDARKHKIKICLKSVSVLVCRPRGGSQCSSVNNLSYVENNNKLLLLLLLLLLLILLLNTARPFVLLTTRKLMTGFRMSKCLVVTRPSPVEQSQYCSSLRPLENCLTKHTAIQHFTPASGNCFRKWAGHDVTVRKKLDREGKQNRCNWGKWSENRRKN